MYLKNYTVLFADDDAEYAEHFAQTLTHFFSDVIKAKDGQEALEFYSKQICDVVILDVEMPKLNGLEVAEKIRNENEDIPIFIVTSHPDFEYIRKGFKLKLVDFILKPINFEDLLQTLKRCENLLKSKLDVNVINDVFYNYKSKFLYDENEKYNLSSFEVLVLELLLKNKGKLVSYEEFEVSLSVHDLSLVTLKNTIYKLRQKLPKNTILSLSKMGYLIK